MTGLNDLRDEMVDIITSGLRADVPPDELAERIGKASVFDDFADDLVELVLRAQRSAKAAPVAAPTVSLPQINLTVQQDTSQLADAMRERDAEQLAAMKALSEVRPVVNVAPAAVVVDVPAQAAPVVNVEPVIIPAPVVNVEQPSEKASLPQEIRIVSMPDRVSSTRKTIKRGPNGLVSEVTEQTVDEDG